MPFIKWLSRNQATPAPDPKLTERLSEIENQLAILREEIKGNSFVIIEHADRVIVEKVDYSNHFGTLEVDNLQGQLNIGRNHQTSIPSDKLLSLVKKAAILQRGNQTVLGSDESGQNDTTKEGPKCNIHARKNE